MSRPDEPASQDAISERKPADVRTPVRPQARRQIGSFATSGVRVGVVLLRVAWVFHVASFLLALLVAVGEVRSVIVSGPLLTLFGLALAGVSLAAAYRLGFFAALTTPALCLFLFVVIAALRLSPQQAQLPVYLFGSLYALALVGFLVVVLRWRGRAGFVTVRVELPERLHAVAQQEAIARGVTIEQLLVQALAEKVLPRDEAEPLEAVPVVEDTRFRGGREWVAEGSREQDRSEE